MRTELCLCHQEHMHAAVSANFWSANHLTQNPHLQLASLNVHPSNISILLHSPMLSHTSRARNYISNGLVPFLSTTLALIALRDNVIDINTITGRSMQPTLSPNYHLTAEADWILFWKWQPTKGLQRGDVILFNNPRDPEKMAAKRVIALGGDTVLLNTRRRPDDVLNGRLSEDARRWDIQFQKSQGRVVVPPNHVWVEGDNVARHSSDSNAYGPISKALIIGKAIRVIKPLGQFWTRPWENGNGNGRRTKVVPGVEILPDRNHPPDRPFWFGS